MLWKQISELWRLQDNRNQQRKHCFEQPKVDEVCQKWDYVDSWWQWDQKWEVQVCILLKKVNGKSLKFSAIICYQ